MIKFTPLFVLLLSTTALAQEAPRPDAAAAAPEGDTVIVTATRSETPIDRVPASVTVLDKAAVDRNQDLGVAELLLRTPGVTLSRNGGYGTNTSLRIRGAESDQTVVVIDGVKLNDPSSAGGGYNFANLLVGDAARIEVLRGPQSILWGSQAIGGVVNIVTPLATRELEGSFDVEAGSRETVSGRAALGGRTGPLAWRVGAQTFSTQGISALAPAFGGRDLDGYSNQSVQGRAVLDIAGGVSADVRGYYSHGRTELDSTSADTRDYSLNREFVGYAGLNVDLFDARLRNRFAYGYTDTDRDNYNPARARAQNFDSAGRNERLEYQGSVAITKGWNGTFGVENERSRFRSVSPPASLAARVPDPARGRAEITGVYAQLNATPFDGLTLTGGVRNDDHSRFGSQTLFAGGAVWALPTGTILRANYAEGFKAPTLYQLFSEYGNQALNPEEAKGWEAGAEQRVLGGALAFGATYFERRTTNQIIFNSCTATSTLPLCFQPGSTTRRSGYYQNVARAFARGVEAVARAQIGTRLALDGNYSWVESEDRSPGATDGLWLPRRPRHAANASATYTPAQGYALGVAARWSGRSFDNAANTTELDGYTLVDLRAELPVTEQVKLFARVENLFDEEYQTTYRYGTLGRSVYAGFRGRF
ncbi:TonB-dependent receptor plug domain-containing protein [Sphingomonas sp. S2-65]|uniref:TonB-dependent receptor plug domain-containing protein n=1 Tax=Sphingomonas sp. S2-65 TaxID=2903960 RepID=UPI001F260A17|nr:TonB-dependent receptor [Sphingomonas sp. S2-65]UYY59208.1 TonB-dependent receptor [Sphingomonas sp. S2-65]